MTAAAIFVVWPGGVKARTGHRGQCCSSRLEPGRAAVECFILDRMQTCSGSDADAYTQSPHRYCNAFCMGGARNWFLFSFNQIKASLIFKFFTYILLLSIYILKQLFYYHITSLVWVLPNPWTRELGIQQLFKKKNNKHDLQVEL